MKTSETGLRELQELLFRTSSNTQTHTHTHTNIYIYIYAVVQLVEALRYKSEGRGFDSRWCFFYSHNPSGRTMATGLTQPLTEMRTRNISWGWGVKVAGPCG